MKEYLINFIGAVMAGLLSLLWWDIRSMRSDRQDLTNMIETNEDTAKLLALKTSEEIDKRYMNKDVHSLLCENVTLRMEQTVGKMLKEAVLELKLEIQKNNGSRI